MDYHQTDGRVNSPDGAIEGYIDLSKRRVSPEGIEECTEKYSKAKAVQSILRHVAELLQYTTDEQFEELYRNTAWHFEEENKKLGSAYDVFKQAVNEPWLLDECGLDDKTKEMLLLNIQRKLTLASVKIRADIEVACYGYEGIDAVKEALTAGLACSAGTDMPIKINLIAPPLYVMTTNTPEKQDGLRLLEAACQAVKQKIAQHNGKFEIKMAPKIVTETDEADLQQQMDKAEAETREVDGDDPASGSDSASDVEGEPAPQ